jgi:hypothetical protein
MSKLQDPRPEIEPEDIHFIPCMSVETSLFELHFYRILKHNKRLSSKELFDLSKLDHHHTTHTFL